MRTVRMTLDEELVEAVDLDRVQTVSRGPLGAFIASLPREKMEAVRNGLLLALGLESG